MLPKLLMRIVGFNAEGLAVCAGVAAEAHPSVTTREVMNLPFDGYDFIDYDVRGKTKAEIQMDMAWLTYGQLWSTSHDPR